MKDLAIEADVGIHAYEVGKPQRLLITADVEISPVQEDRISGALDYTYIVALAEEIGRERIALIETFARRLALGLLAHPKRR